MPFYQFNSFTGRLAESSRVQPLYPVSPVRLDRVEPPKIMFDLPSTKPVRVAPAVGSSASYSTLRPELARKMELFQKKNSVPVYLKGGTPDKILLGITCTLIGVGLVECGRLFYELSFPKKG